jgi:hypothetical protein
MLKQLKKWFKARQRRASAIRRAIIEFQNSHGANPMGGCVIHDDAQGTIVRVMYMTDHIPPDRAWFAVSEEDHPIRELSFDDVCKFESPWR